MEIKEKMEKSILVSSDKKQILQSLIEEGIVLWHSPLNVDSRAADEYRIKNVCSDIYKIKISNNHYKPTMIVTNPISWSRMTEILSCFPEIREAGLSELLTFAEAFNSFDKGINLNLVATRQVVPMPKRCLALMGKSTVYSVGLLLLFNTRERHYSYLLCL